MAAELGVESGHGSLLHVPLAFSVRVPQKPNRLTAAVSFELHRLRAGGKRPLDLLRRGKLSAILRAARLHGVHAAI